MNLAMMNVRGTRTDRLTDTLSTLYSGLPVNILDLLDNQLQKTAG